MPTRQVPMSMIDIATRSPSGDFLHNLSFPLHCCVLSAIQVPKESAAEQQRKNRSLSASSNGIRCILAHCDSRNSSLSSVPIRWRNEAMLPSFRYRLLRASVTPYHDSPDPKQYNARTIPSARKVTLNDQINREDEYPDLDVRKGTARGKVLSMNT